MYDMKTLSIRIDDDIKRRWSRLAEQHGLNPSQHMRDAIVSRLEELEDFYVVKERLAQPYQTIAHEDVLHRLGLNENADAD